MTINGSVVKPTEVMSERESIESFCEGAKKAYSAAMELAPIDGAEWINIANTLRAMHDGGKQLADMRSMSRLETLMAANIKTASHKPN